MSFLADDAREYVLHKVGAEETTPFGPDVLVYKVCGKMFATLAFEGESARMNLKCEPSRAAGLREQYSEIIPGYHMNKKHWNTITLGASLPKELVSELIDHSYDLVCSGLTRKQRAELVLCQG